MVALTQPKPTEAAPKRRTLHHISDDLMAVEQLLAEIDGDVSDPKVAEAVDAWLAEINKDLEGKTDNYAALITEIERRADARKAEATRMTALAKTDQSHADWLKSRLMGALKLHNIDKVEGNRFRVSVCNNGGKAPLDIHDPNAVPVKFCKLIPAHREPDPDLIRDAIAAGKAVPGAVIQERGQHLRIK